jgi:hypothetical protein
VTIDYDQVGPSGKRNNALDLFHTQVRSETLHIRGRQSALFSTGALYEEVPMPQSLENDKQTDQAREDLRWLGLAALVMVLILATAALVGAIF